MESVSRTGEVSFTTPRTPLSRSMNEMKECLRRLGSAWLERIGSSNRSAFFERSPNTLCVARILRFFRRDVFPSLAAFLALIGVFVITIVPYRESLLSVEDEPDDGCFDEPELEFEPESEDESSEEE